MKYVFAADVNSRRESKGDSRVNQTTSRIDISACPRDFLMRDCAPWPRRSPNQAAPNQAAPNQPAMPRASCDLSRRCTHRRRAADGRSVTETTMRTVEVVVFEPRRELLISFF